MNTSGNINLLGNLNAGNVKLTTTNNGNINLFNQEIKALNRIEVLADGSINGLDRDNFPRLTAPYIILSGDKVGDINAPIGLTENILGGYIIDRSNQTLLTPAPYHYFGYSAITKLLLNESAYLLYPIVMSPLHNGFFTALKNRDGKAPVIAGSKEGKPIIPSKGGLFVSTSGTYILYGDKAQTEKAIPEFENYIQASGKLLLDEQNSSNGGQFVPTEGKMIMPNMSSSENEYNIYAGTFLPVEYGDLSFARDKDREIKN